MRLGAREESLTKGSSYVLGDVGSRRRYGGIVAWAVIWFPCLRVFHHDGVLFSLFGGKLEGVNSGVDE